MSRILAALAVALMLIPAATGARAAELLMFEARHCMWCQRWNADIGGMFHLTPEAKRAPLHRVDADGTPPVGIELAAKVTYTPTFVLVDGGREVGRIEGYPGEDFFWAMLDRLIGRLPADASIPTN